MPLVQYSDSESDSDSRPFPKKPRPINPGPSLPPLPAAFHDLYAASTRVSLQDDPSLHGGRKRAIPHVEGNWPTHLYLEWYPAKHELSLLAGLITQCETSLDENSPRVHSLLHSDLGVQLPLHISLSRPVILRTEQRAAFTETLQNAILDSHVPPFQVKPNTLYWASNHESTRWFLVFSVQKPDQNHLNRLLKLSNECLASFNQPPLYASPRTQGKRPRPSLNARKDDVPSDDFSECFHISLAWTLTEPSSKDHEKITGIDLQALKELQIGFDSLKAKIGNNVTSIPLGTA